jgi:hypothetical protein
MRRVLQELAGDAQARRRGAGVGGDLARGGDDGSAGDELGERLAAAGADGQVRRADAAARAVGEEALHAPVLEEWNDIAPKRPPGRSRLQATGSASSIWPSSSLTAMRIAWNVRLAGWPPAKRAAWGWRAG